MYLDLFSLKENINLTVSKENLQYFAEVLVQKFTEKSQGTQYPAQMTIFQVSSYLNYSRPTIYKMVGNNSIPFYKMGSKGKLLFKKSEIDAWLTEKKHSTVSEFIVKQGKRK